MKSYSVATRASSSMSRVLMPEIRARTITSDALTSSSLERCWNSALNVLSAAPPSFLAASRRLWAGNDTNDARVSATTVNRYLIGFPRYHPHVFLLADPYIALTMAAVSLEVGSMTSPTSMTPQAFVLMTD